jgi:hypothetical protein
MLVEHYYISNTALFPVYKARCTLNNRTVWRHKMSTSFSLHSAVSYEASLIPNHSFPKVSAVNYYTDLCLRAHVTHSTYFIMRRALLLANLSCCAVSAPLYAYNEGQVGLVDRVTAPPSPGAAWGTFDDKIDSTGWSFLEIHTSPNVTDEEAAYAAGYLEATLTAERTWQYFINCDSPTSLDKKVCLARPDYRVSFTVNLSPCVFLCLLRRKPSLWRRTSCVT